MAREKLFNYLLVSNSIMYLVISLIVLFFSFFLFRAASGSMALNQLNMISYIFYKSLFLESFIGSLLIVYQLDNHYVINTISNPNVRIYGWMCVLYTMIALPTGILIANKLLAKKTIKHQFRHYMAKPLTTHFSFQDSYIRIILYGLTLISFLSILYTFYQIRSFPIAELIYGDLSRSSAAQLRQETTRNFSGIVYIRNIFGLLITPILSYITYCYWKITNKTFDCLWFFLSILQSIIILAYNLEKSPLAFFVLSFIFLQVFVKKKVSYKLLITFTISVFLILITMYIAILGTDFSDVSVLLFNYNIGITGRIILSQIAGLFMAFDYFPNIHPFIGLASMSKLISSLLGIQYVDRFGRIAMTLFNPSAVASGTAGTMPSLFVAEAWANFGIIGVILSPLWVGFLIGIVYMLFLNSKKSPVFLGLFVYFSYKWPVTLGFNDFIYNGGIIATILIMFTSLIVAYRLKINTVGKKKLIKNRKHY